MRNYIYKIMTVALLFGATSCDSFLQKDPPSSPSQSIFWQRKSDFNSALAGTYSVMHEGVFSQTLPCLDGLTDNAIVQHDEATYGSVKTIAQGDLTPQQNGYVSDLYNRAYRGINRVHIILEKLEAYTGKDISDDERAFIVAQCKALRGYFYSYLYQFYKEVPVITHSLDTETMIQPKATRAEVLNRVIEDYDEAINTLPDKLYSDADVSGRFTVSAVKALKARILLFDAYDENGVAIPAQMEKVLSLLQGITGYDLAARTRDNFISDRQLASPEIMFSVRFLAPNIRNSYDLLYAAWAALNPTRDMIDAFECTDGEPWATSPLAVHPNEEVLYGADDNLKEAERDKLFMNRDRRLYESVNHSAKANFAADGLEDKTILINELGNKGLTGFSMLKLVQPTAVMPSYSTVSDADYVIMRYAHVLLMIAESENEVHGATSVALDAINKVRTRSGQPAIAVGISKEDLRQRIRNEWRVETCFEGLRYTQLKRWKLMESLVNGIEDPALLGYIKVYEPAFEFFPLPQSQINRSQGQLIQDPAYE